MLNYKTYKPNTKKADLLISRDTRKSELYHLLENVKNPLCYRQYGQKGRHYEKNSRR